jgi:hypothetical protein
VSSELRWDALAGAWVGVAGGRQDRPNLPTGNCPFCVGGIEAPAAYEVTAFANRRPLFTPGDPTALDPTSGHVPARGAAEIVLCARDPVVPEAAVEALRRASLPRAGPRQPDRRPHRLQRRIRPARSG